MALNMDEKIAIKNLCNWDLGFRRIESVGDVSIPPNATVRTLTRSEVIAQCQSNNTLFVGTDGMGSHARIYIVDKPTRIEVGFETEDSKETQNILSEDTMKSIYDLKTISAFKKRVKENVITHAEKSKFAEYAKKAKINDYDKIKFVEEYTGFKIDAITE